MLLRLLLLFITVPLVELYLLLQLAGFTGAGPTFLLVIITGIIGSWLAKREGLIAWQKFQLALAEGRMPSREIQDGLMIVFSAALLLTPGLLTDIVGFVMLVPVGRNLIRKFVLSRLFRGFGSGGFGSGGSGSGGSGSGGFGSVHVHTKTTFESTPLHPFDDSKTIEGRATRR
ncbi:FxsA family protein [Planctomycetes bacterium TBK1r]|uniref:Phage T7 F exclusion suppressor FxsA n=1 Tax=Stieleria magnilauensis TaxID=2527963 RepID=A0ABX5Y3K8_9BACT|nr:phage T7 F exclusion suppressor FxsA [Planctomycetes bacterium TBK1r]